MKRKIEVVVYDPEWKNQFEMEAVFLREVFSDLLLDVHHIGSTAIPGIEAKPIVDVMPVVSNIEKVDDFNEFLEKQGYLVKGENGIAGRRFFIKGTEALRSHHIHVFQQGNAEIEKHLNFRDYMRAYPRAAEDYSKLKQELAVKFPHDGAAYSEAKNDFIQEVDHKAKTWAAAKRSDRPSV